MNTTDCTKASANMMTMTCKNCGMPAVQSLVGVRSRTQKFSSMHITVEQQLVEIARRDRILKHLGM